MAVPTNTTSRPNAPIPNQAEAVRRSGQCGQRVPTRPARRKAFSNDQPSIPARTAPLMNATTAMAISTRFNDRYAGTATISLKISRLLAAPSPPASMYTASRCRCPARIHTRSTTMPAIPLNRTAISPWGFPLRNSTAPFSRPVTVPAPGLPTTPTARINHRRWMPAINWKPPGNPTAARSDAPTQLTALPDTPPSAASAAMVSSSRREKR